MSNKKARLRALLKGDKIIVAPGVFDCLGAKVVESAGFPAAYLTGFGTSISVLGKPDLGLLTMTECVTQAKKSASSGNGLPRLPWINAFRPAIWKNTIGTGLFTSLAPASLFLSQYQINVTDRLGSPAGFKCFSAAGHSPSEFARGRLFHVTGRPVRREAGATTR